MYASQVFNIDESGFSARKASLSHVKAFFRASSLANSIALNWSSKTEHLTLIPVVSADGRAWSPISILPGMRAKYRTREDGRRETPVFFYLPKQKWLIALL